LTVAYSEQTEALEVICERSGTWGNPLESASLPDAFGVNIIRHLAAAIDYPAADGRSRLVVRIATGE